jgi:hypothetical protein
MFILWSLFAIQPPMKPPQQFHSFFSNEDSRVLFSSLVRMDQPPSWYQLKKYVDFHRKLFDCQDIDALDAQQGIRKGIILQKLEDNKMNCKNIFNVCIRDDGLCISDIFWGNNSDSFFDKTLCFVIFISWYESVAGKGNIFLSTEQDQEEWCEAKLFCK